MSRVELADEAQRALAALDLHDGVTFRSWPVWVFEPPLQPRHRRLQLLDALIQLVDVVLGVRSKISIAHRVQIRHETSPFKGCRPVGPGVGFDGVESVDASHSGVAHRQVRRAVFLLSRARHLSGRAGGVR